jgi:hypothetical protein
MAMKQDSYNQSCERDGCPTHARIVSTEMVSELQRGLDMG